MDKKLNCKIINDSSIEELLMAEDQDFAVKVQRLLDEFEKNDIKFRLPPRNGMFVTKEGHLYEYNSKCTSIWQSGIISLSEAQILLREQYVGIFCSSLWRIRRSVSSVYHQKIYGEHIIDFIKRIWWYAYLH
jgi:hypothetical protein